MSVRRSSRFLVFAVFVIAFLAGAQVVCAAQERDTRVVQMVNVTTQLEKTVDAKKNKAGDSVTAKVTAGTTLSDGTNVPPGSILSGHIDSVTPSEKKGDSTVVLTFDKLAAKNGRELRVKAVVVQVASYADQFGQQQANNDPDANRGTHSTVGTPGAEVIAHPQDNNNATGLHPVAGLTLSGSPNNSSSATLTQAKKNLHLTNATQLVVSVAVLP